MLFRGTKKWPDSTTLSKKLDGVGGFYNAFTDKEVLGIIIKVGTENLSLAIEAVGEMVRRPLLGLADLAKEKKTIIEEINMKEDNPQVAVLDFWEELLYGEQPAGWPIIGEKEIVMTISRQDLFRHLRNFFVGENSLMAIAGNFKEKEARAIIGKTWRD
jgi:predicted Zn-dependent peptidase